MDESLRCLVNVKSSIDLIEFAKESEFIAISVASDTKNSWTRSGKIPIRNRNVFCDRNGVHEFLLMRKSDENVMETKEIQVQLYFDRANTGILHVSVDDMKKRDVLNASNLIWTQVINDTSYQMYFIQSCMLKMRHEKKNSIPLLIGSRIMSSDLMHAQVISPYECVKVRIPEPFESQEFVVAVRMKHKIVVIGKGDLMSLKTMKEWNPIAISKKIHRIHPYLYREGVMNCVIFSNRKLSKNQIQFMLKERGIALHSEYTNALIDHEMQERWMLFDVQLAGISVCILSDENRIQGNDLVLNSRSNLLEMIQLSVVGIEITCAIRLLNCELIRCLGSIDLIQIDNQFQRSFPVLSHSQLCESTRENAQNNRMISIKLVSQEPPNQSVLSHRYARSLYIHTKINPIEVNIDPNLLWMLSNVVSSSNTSRLSNEIENQHETPLVQVDQQSLKLTLIKDLSISRIQVLVSILRFDSLLNNSFLMRYLSPLIGFHHGMIHIAPAFLHNVELSSLSQQLAPHYIRESVTTFMWLMMGSNVMNSVRLLRNEFPSLSVVAFHTGLFDAVDTAIHESIRIVFSLLPISITQRFAMNSNGELGYLENQSTRKRIVQSIDALVERIESVFELNYTETREVHENSEVSSILSSEMSSRRRSTKWKRMESRLEKNIALISRLGKVWMVVVSRMIVFCGEYVSMLVSQSTMYERKWRIRSKALNAPRMYGGFDGKGLIEFTNESKVLGETVLEYYREDRNEKFDWFMIVSEDCAVLMSTVRILKLKLSAFDEEQRNSIRKLIQKQNAVHVASRWKLIECQRRSEIVSVIQMKSCSTVSLICIPFKVHSNRLKSYFTSPKSSKAVQKSANSIQCYFETTIIECQNEMLVECVAQKIQNSLNNSLPKDHLKKEHILTRNQVLLL
uniref:Uncharacterized protein n=1 Tax=Timspurckia oligopyrenoides TaxID=708627 RepID=A0A7S0ZFJ2_9RHOD